MAKSDAAASSSNVSNEVILSFILEALGAKRKVEEATGAYRAVLKRAKAQGCSTKGIVEAIQAKRQDPEEVKRELRDRIRYLACINMPVHQADLFEGLDAGSLNTNGQTDLQHADANEQGYSAGRAGAMAESCPFPAGTELAVIWRSGWAEGQEAIAAEMGPDEAVAPARRGKGRKSVSGVAPTPAAPKAVPPNVAPLKKNARLSEVH